MDIDGVSWRFSANACSRMRVWLSVVTLGELRRGGIHPPSRRRSAGRIAGSWLTELMQDYRDSVLTFDLDTAQVWGRLRVPPPEKRAGQANRRYGADP